MTRWNSALAVCGVALMLGACSRDSGAAKSDSAAADSIRDAHSAADTSMPAGVGGAGDSAQGPINSTEGTIGETRKPRVRMHAPDTADRDSAIAGPYKTMDSMGRIKR